MTTDRRPDPKYLLLTTFKRDGTAVATPVWAVRIGDEFQVLTDPGSGKVKRVRNSGRVLIAPCTVRGKPLGDPAEGIARIIAPDEMAALRAGLIKKYGLQARIGPIVDRLRGLVGKAPRPLGGVAVTLAP